MKQEISLLALALALPFVCILPVQSTPSESAGANASTEDRPTEIILGKSHITVELAAGDLFLSHAAIQAWVKRSATAVARYYGHFPVAHATVRISPSSGSGFGFATTDSEGDQGIIAIPIGQYTSQAELDKDWVLTHEMVHLAFPLVYHHDRWLAEGMATYIEPLARMQAGFLSDESIWKDLVDGLPKGLPKMEDQGLNDSHSIRRIYWGGALFCLLADLEIRKATANKKGLQNALQAIVTNGGDITSNMEVPDALRLGDKAIGANKHILENLYNKMKDQAVAPDLNKLWQELGVKKTGETVTFDDQAPLAPARKAIDAGSNR